ncbi:hypothetical protein L218DRAFT_940354 [Marasmius fiardii PR-910]|nr:hypothetical protein L218DRAFT_940354 [Marasmius fiardii PR-910]
MRAQLTPIYLPPYLVSLNRYYRVTIPSAMINRNHNQRGKNARSRDRPGGLTGEQISRPMPISPRRQTQHRNYRVSTTSIKKTVVVGSTTRTDTSIDKSKKEWKTRVKNNLAGLGFGVKKSFRPETEQKENGGLGITAANAYSRKKTNHQRSHTRSSTSGEFANTRTPVGTREDNSRTTMSPNSTFSSLRAIAVIPSPPPHPLSPFSSRPTPNLKAQIAALRRSPSTPPSKHQVTMTMNHARFLHARSFSLDKRRYSVPDYHNTRSTRFHVKTLLLKRHEKGVTNPSEVVTAPRSGIGGFVKRWISSFGSGNESGICINLPYNASPYIHGVPYGGLQSALKLKSRYGFTTGENGDPELEKGPSNFPEARSSQLKPLAASLELGMKTRDQH